MGTTSSSNLERMSKLQKRAARIILLVDFNTPSAEMFKELSWLPILKLLKIQQGRLYIQSHEQFDIPIYHGFTETHNRTL